MGVLVVEAVAVAVEGDCLLLHLPLPLLLVGFPTGTQIVEVAKAVVGPRPPRLPRGIPMGTPEGVVAMAMDQVIHPEVKRGILPLPRMMSLLKARKRKWTKLWLHHSPRQEVLRTTW
jgi:hypothetical protein